jgi:hypothetical protein
LAQRGKQADYTTHFHGNNQGEKTGTNGLFFGIALLQQEGSLMCHLADGAIRLIGSGNGFTTKAKMSCITLTARQLFINNERQDGAKQDQQ